MSVKTSVHTDSKATQRVRLADAHAPASFPEPDVDPKATRQLVERLVPDALSGPDAQATQQVRVPPSPPLQPGGDLRQTHEVRLVDAGSAPDPKATQRIRLPKAPRPSDSQTTQPFVLVPSSDAAERAGAAVQARPTLGQWAARHKRTLILIGALAAVAILAISFAVLQSARGVRQIAVGSGGRQMRAASLAQADLSGQDLKWADLSRADLRQANLASAEMIGANLSGAELAEANLQNAVLRGADLSGAKLQQAVLRQADLHWAVLRNADLSGADLRGADLQGADLENATLEGANLEGANLKNAHVLGTILPDGTRWTPSINVRRFTDPTQPDFWRPDDAQSLALR